MEMQDMPTKGLLELHNRIADKAAGPKTFSTRAKLVARIERIAAEKNVDLASFGRGAGPEAAGQLAQTRAPAAEAAGAQPDVVRTFDLVPASSKKPRGLGVGRLARELLLHAEGYPHAVIAAMVNAMVDGAHATDKSVRWYANDMRKKGVEVPPRRKQAGDD